MPHARLARTALTCFAVIAATAALPACDVVVNSMEGGRAKATDVRTRTYTLAAAGEVEIVNGNGRIDVEGVDGATLDVRIEISARSGTEEAAKELLTQVEVLEEKGASRVRLETRYPRELRRAGLEVHYTVRVPKTALVDLKNTNGGIQIAGMTGSVKAETTNGGVKGRDLAGGVRASTTNGGVDVAVSAVSPDGITLETTNGGVELKLPAEARATVSARCVNGGIRVTDLSIEKSESTRRRLDGTLNGGGPAIRLETVNGGIRLGRS